MSKNKVELEIQKKYESYIGKYINLSCHVENHIIVFITYHFLGVASGKKADELIKLIFSKQNFAFQSATSAFLRIINNGDYDNQIKEHKTILSKKSLNNMVNFRNKLAHSLLADTTESEDSLKLWWLNSEFDDANYQFPVKYEEMDAELENLRRIHLSVTSLTKPIIDQVKDSNP